MHITIKHKKNRSKIHLFLKKIKFKNKKQNKVREKKGTETYIISLPPKYTLFHYNTLTKNKTKQKKHTKKKNNKLNQSSVGSV